MNLRIQQPVGANTNPGEVIFPDGFVLEPGGSFNSTVLSCKVVWNEYVARELGGGFVASYDAPRPVTAGRELVETIVMSLNTDHGVIGLALVGIHRFMLLKFLDQLKLTPADLVSRQLTLRTVRLQKEIGTGELKTQISFWTWDWEIVR